MATKKPTTKPATEEPQPSAPTRAAKDRPFAESPAPEHCRVELCTAMAEWMRGLEPDAPQPVFSTKALMHGAQAVGAARLKEGFSFNPQMDLLWATGFPQVAFIVDGLPVPDTIPALLALHRVDERMGHLDYKNWWTAQIIFGRVYTRRGAWARLFECSPYPEGVDDDEKADFASTVFELEEDDFERLTRDSELAQFHLHNTLLFSAKQNELSNDALLLEALLGPDAVVNAIMELLEASAPSLPALDGFLALQPLALRLGADAHSSLLSRVRKWSDQAKSEERGYALCLLDFDANAKAEMDRDGALGVLYRPYLPPSSREADWIRAEAAADPSLRHNDAFIGDCDTVLTHLTKLFSKFEPGDTDEGYLQNLSAVRSPLILEPLLRIGAAEHSRPMVRAWFDAHGTWAAPHLTILAAGTGKISKLAKQELAKQP